ncbi:MAG: hypothetical protein LBI18_01865 [Planctomycetaceae bacterium]|jgi:hypothetical protein|nr:hypothetical protein [Planctomycetaceae bacterium]
MNNKKHRLQLIIQFFVFFITIIVIIYFLFYKVWEAESVLYLKRINKLYNGDDTDVIIFIDKYCNSDSQIRHGIMTINKANLSGIDSPSLWKCPFVKPYQSYQSIFYANILALDNKKEIIVHLRKNLTNYIKILKFKKNNIKVEFGDDLANAPIPLRTYVWALLYLGGIEEFQWLENEIYFIFNDELTNDAQKILDFSTILVWKTNFNIEEDVSNNILLRMTCFDENWDDRFLAVMQFEVLSKSERQLIDFLEHIIKEKKSNLTFKEKWKICSASILFRHLTGESKYKKYFPSAYGSILVDEKN